jgi:hypothetical protein
MDELLVMQVGIIYARRLKPFRRNWKTHTTDERFDPGGIR